MIVQRFVPAILIGLTVLLVLLISSSLTLSLILKFTSVTENAIGWLIITLAFIAMFIGGVIAGAKAKGKGWIVGACTALLFTMITFAIQYLGYEHNFTGEQYLFHSGYLLIATLGGIIGVNISNHT